MLKLSSILQLFVMIMPKTGLFPNLEYNQDPYILYPDKRLGYLALILKLQIFKLIISLEKMNLGILKKELI